jgi:hypothetical protein
MANIYQGRLNMTSVVTEAEEDNDADPEKVERLLEEEDNVNDADKEKVDSSLEKEDKFDDDETIDCCN